MRYKLHYLLLVIFSFIGTRCTGQESTLTATALETTSAHETVTTLETTIGSEKTTTTSPGSEIEVTATDEKVTLEKTSTPAVLEPGSLQGTRILFWHPWTGDSADILGGLSAEFNRGNQYDIEVIPVSQGSDLFEKVRQSLITGQFPHMVLASTYDLLSWQQTRDIFLDLNEYIEDPNQGLSESVINDFEPSLWEQDSINDVRLGIPSHAVSTLLAYNDTWAKELGFTTPSRTPLAIRFQACESAAESNIGDNWTGGLSIRLDPSGMMSWIMAFGGAMTDETGDEPDFNSPEVMDALVYMKSLFEDGCAWNPGVPYAEEEFATRKGLFYATTILDLPYITEAFQMNDLMDSWIVLPYPTEFGSGLVNITPYSYAILESTPEEQLATWLFLKWVINPEHQALMVETNSTYPARISTISFLDQYVDDHPQWAEAYKLFPYGKVEPRLSSWSIFRWAVSEAGSELISPEFTRDQIPSLLENLNSLLAEIKLDNP